MNEKWKGPICPSGCPLENSVSKTTEEIWINNIRSSQQKLMSKFNSLYQSTIIPMLSIRTSNKLIHFKIYEAILVHFIKYFGSDLTEKLLFAEFVNMANNESKNKITRDIFKVIR
jgi:Ca2+-binding EF-hand superfamily protein